MQNLFFFFTEKTAWNIFQQFPCEHILKTTMTSYLFMFCLDIKMKHCCVVVFAFNAECLRTDAKDTICLNLSAPKGESIMRYKYRYSVYLHFYTLNMEVASIDGTTAKWARCMCSWRRTKVSPWIDCTTPKYLSIHMMSWSSHHMSRWYNKKHNQHLLTWPTSS